MARWSVLAALALGFSLVSPVATPVAAQEVGTEEPLDPAVLDDFLALWKQRLAEPGYLQRHVDAGNPQDPQFADLPVKHKLQMVQHLVSWLVLESPDFAASLHPPGQESSWAGREHFAAVLFYALIFDVSLLKDSVDPGSDEVAHDEGGEGPLTSDLYDPITGEAFPDVTALREALDARRAYDGVPVQEPQPSRALAALEPAAAPLRAEAPPVALVDVEPRTFPLEPRAEAVPVTPVFAPRIALPPPPLPLPPSPVLDDPAGFANALTYIACGQVPLGAINCSLPVPFGTPVVLDLNDHLGPDVGVLLAPAALPTFFAHQPQVPPTQEYLEHVLASAAGDALGSVAAPGLGVTLRIGTLPDTEDLPCNASVGPGLHAEFHCLYHLPSQTQELLAHTANAFVGAQNLTAKVWVLYSLASPTEDVDKLLRLGVDGTSTKLPEVTTATLKLHDLQELLAGRAKGNLNITFDQPGDDVGLFVEVSDAGPDGQPVDPTAVNVVLEPVPDLQLDFDALLDGTYLDAVLTASLSPLVTLTYTSENADEGTTTLADAVIDRLPERVRATYESLTDGTRIAYDASAEIELISAAFQRTEPTRVVAGTAAVHELPEQVEVHLRPDEQVGFLNYDASDVVPLVEATFSLVEGGVTTTGSIEVHDIPSRFDVAWNTEETPKTITYDASSSLGPVLMEFNSGPGRLAAEASLESLPPYMEAQFSDDVVTFDARSGPLDPPASGTLGALHLAFATDGAFLGGQPSEDHASLQQLADGTTRADLLYTGLQFARADLRNGETHLEVRNADPRFFVYWVDLPGAYIAGHIDSIPAHVNIDLVGDLVHYDSHAQVIDEIFVDFSDKGAPPLLATITVEHIPSTIDLTLDLEGQRIGYEAGDEVHLVTGDASIPTPDTGIFDIHLEVETIPTSWEVAFADGGFAFDSPDGIGRVLLQAENYAAPDTPCDAAPNHLCAVLDLPDLLFTVDFALLDVEHAELQNLEDGVYVRLDAGAGQPFVASGLLDIEDDLRATLAATIDSLPTSLELTTGPVVTYQADDNFDLVLTAAVGDPAVLPTIPDPMLYPLGVTVRADAAFHDFKAAVQVTGVPTYVRIDTANAAFEMEDFRPKSTQLVVDAILTPVGTTPKIQALITVDNVVAAVGEAQDLSVSFHPSSNADGTEKRIQAHFESATELGPINGTVLIGIDQLVVEISNLPTMVDLDARLGETASVITYDADAQVDRVFVGFALDSDPTLDLDMAGELKEVPPGFTLTLGRNEVGPTVDYHAEASTLDVALSVGATLFDDGVKARILAGIENLGADVSVANVPGVTETKTRPDHDTPDPCDEEEYTETSDEGLRLTSTPATTMIFVDVWVEAAPSVSDFGTECFTFVADFFLNWGYDVDLGIAIDRLHTHILGLRDMTVKPGFPLKVSGSYDVFNFGWNDLLLTVDFVAGADLDACWRVDIDAGEIQVHETFCFDNLLALSTPHLALVVTDVWFHLANQHEGPWIPLELVFSVCFLAFSVDFGLHLGTVDLAPDPSHGATKNAFTTYGTGSPLGDAGNAKWYVLPDLDAGGGPLLDTWLAGFLIMLLADSGDAGIGLTIDPSPVFGFGGPCLP